MVGVGCAVCGGSAGCLAQDNEEPLPEIVGIEIRNDRREERHEFVVQIEEEKELVFDETYQLEPAGQGGSLVVIEEIDEPGAYTVRVETDEHAASVDTQDLISDDRRCIRLQFYLRAETLHAEYQLYDRCE